MCPYFFLEYIRTRAQFKYRYTRGEIQCLNNWTSLLYSMKMNSEFSHFHSQMFYLTSWSVKPLKFFCNILSFKIYKTGSFLLFFGLWVKIWTPEHPLNAIRHYERVFFLYAKQQHCKYNTKSCKISTELSGRKHPTLSALQTTLYVQTLSPKCHNKSHKATTKKCQEKRA